MVMGTDSNENTRVPASTQLCVVSWMVCPLTQWFGWFRVKESSVSRSSEAWRGRVSEDAWLLTFTSPESIGELQRWDIDCNYQLDTMKLGRKRGSNKYKFEIKTRWKSKFHIFGSNIVVVSLLNLRKLNKCATFSVCHVSNFISVTVMRLLYAWSCFI